MQAVTPSGMIVPVAETRLNPSTQAVGTAALVAMAPGKVPASNAIEVRAHVAALRLGRERVTRGLYGTSLTLVERDQLDLRQPGRDLCGLCGAANNTQHTPWQTLRSAQHITPQLARRGARGRARSA